MLMATRLEEIRRDSQASQVISGRKLEGDTSYADGNTLMRDPWGELRIIGWGG